MRYKPTSIRTLLGALLVAGGMVAACSSRARHSDTTVAQAPLGESHAELPSNPSVPPPDAAETAPPPIEHAQSLSRRPAASAPGVATPRAPAASPAPSNNSNATANGTGISTDTDRDSQPANPAPPSNSANGTSMSMVPAELGAFREPLDPYQTRSDGGVDILPRGDAGVTPLPRDAGPISRSDAAIVGPTRDGGIR